MPGFLLFLLRDTKRLDLDLHNGRYFAIVLRCSLFHWARLAGVQTREPLPASATVYGQVSDQAIVVTHYFN